MHFGHFFLAQATCFCTFFWLFFSSRVFPLIFSLFCFFFFRFIFQTFASLDGRPHVHARVVIGDILLVNDQELLVDIRHNRVFGVFDTDLVFAVARVGDKMSTDQIALINLSGRGDKDIFTIAEALGDATWGDFLKEKAAHL